ncbi:MAG: DNA methylase, partial [Oscillospiraceae bacterium]|nr:DNA methylase [Oscillospiraceae bacterium]
VLPEAEAPDNAAAQQLDLFSDYTCADKREAENAKAREREKKRQAAILAIQHKYGKNAILKGTNFEDGAMTRKRNEQIGGHKA